MLSSRDVPRTRKSPSQRRAEILGQASRIALADGLERVTLKAVAEPLGVQPSLIHHYFASAESLVVAAFELAIAGERQQLFATTGTPTERLAALITHLESDSAWELARLWMNARNLSRFRPELASAVVQQESLDRQEMVALLNEGVAANEFTCTDTLAACVRIFIAIDGLGAYANNLGSFTHPAYTHFLSDVTAWATGIPVAQLRAG